MRPHTYDALKLFTLVARYKSLSAAADALHLTKGALSHQIRRLEDELGFPVFDRHPKGIKLTKRGQDLFEIANRAFMDIEALANKLATDGDETLTVGVTTYFASRWLSPRLTGFMQLHSKIRLRIQPMIDPVNFAGERVDIAIRWGNGLWSDCNIQKLFTCPAWPAGNAEALALIKEHGLQGGFDQITLLRDRQDSNVWSNWYKAAGLVEGKHADTLIIPDPNVRVKAALDGQGVALTDELIIDETSRKLLYRLSDVQLDDFGYFLAFEESSLQNPAVTHFIEWISSCALD